MLIASGALRQFLVQVVAETGDAEPKRGTLEVESERPAGPSGPSCPITVPTAVEGVA